MNLPEIVSAEEWRAAHERMLAKEKHATRERDALAAERRRQPMTEITKDYVFEGPDGQATLRDLFEGRGQLILYHFMFAPGVGGWPDAGCPGCSMFVDQVGHLAHFHARETSFALVSRAPLDQIGPYRQRMGWTIPWFSSSGSDFNDDFGVTTPGGETFGLSVFLRDGDRVFRSYLTDAGSRRSAASGRSSTSPRSAGRRTGRTHRKDGRRGRDTSGGAATTSTATKNPFQNER